MHGFSAPATLNNIACLPDRFAACGACIHCIESASLDPRRSALKKPIFVNFLFLLDRRMVKDIRNVSAIHISLAGFDHHKLNPFQPFST